MGLGSMWRRLRGLRTWHARLTGVFCRMGGGRAGFAPSWWFGGMWRSCGTRPTVDCGRWAGGVPTRRPDAEGVDLAGVLLTIVVVVDMALGNMSFVLWVLEAIKKAGWCACGASWCEVGGIVGGC